MSRPRPRPADLLALLGGSVLLVSLFLPWYEDRGADVSAWEAFSVLDFLFALPGLAAVLLFVLVATQRSVAVPIAAGVATVALAILITPLLAYRVIDEAGDNASTTLAIGSYLGLAGILLCGLGAWLSIADETPRWEPEGNEPRPAGSAATP